MMNELELLRKPLTKILLVNWSRFGAVEMKVHNSTLFTGVNDSGKSTVLDALTYTQNYFKLTLRFVHLLSYARHQIYLCARPQEYRMNYVHARIVKGVLTTA